MARILVTGAAGYVGSILCEHLLDAGHEVTALDNLLYDQESLYHFAADRRFSFVRADARDMRVVAEALRSADVAIPLAAIVGAPACDAHPDDARSINRDAVVGLAARTSPDQLVIYPTTNSGYGSAGGTSYCTEETPLRPVSLYGRTKVEAERALLERPNVISFRLATVFGMSPRMRLDLLVNHFVWTALTDRALVLFEKDFKRNYVHVRDVADAFLHAIEHAPAMRGRAYNLGLDDANLSKAELAETVRRFIPDLYVHAAEFGTDPDQRDYIVSNRRLAEAGFRARRSLEEGIRELVVGLRMAPRAWGRNVPALAPGVLRAAARTEPEDFRVSCPKSG